MKVNLKDYKAMIIVMRKDCSEDDTDLKFIKDCTKDFFKGNLTYINQIAENKDVKIPNNKLKGLVIDLLKDLPAKPNKK